LTGGELLLGVSLILPLAMLAACAVPELRERMPALLPFAPLPALAAALLAPNGSTLVLPDALFGLAFVLDRPAAMLLGTAALLWIAAGVYARAYLRGNPNSGSFAVWWLMTLTGSVGVFIAADLVSFYLFFTAVSLAAYGLVVFDDTPSARRAANVYVSLAVLGEAFLIMGFVLLAAGSSGGSLLIRDAVTALSASPWRDTALAFLILGFGLKIGLVPFHIWMPSTYTAAPMPAAAVLSGAAVKAGVIGFIRFLPFDIAMPGWGEALAAVGFLSAFYGVAIGVTRSNPKTVLAYSSISQMGVLAAVLGMGLATGDTSASAAGAFYAVHHILVKGGLFLAVGVAALTNARNLWRVLLPAAVLALGLGGLPLTGGALAKLATKAPLGDGIPGTLGTLSAIASSMLMAHFLRCLAASASQNSETTAPAGLALAWLATALAAVAVPWALYPATNVSYDPLAIGVLWDALWPVLAGVALAAALWRWQHFPPPERDLLPAEGPALRAAQKLGVTMERADWYLQQWPVAGMLFLALTMIMAGAMLIGR
jgi:formate hydrogenlyase subunit 3/multisubunit Na+/H+ antiporter MnhD subunit